MHYGMSGQPLFVPPSQSSLVNYGHFKRPGSASAPPKLQPLPSIDRVSAVTSSRPAGTSATSPAAVVSDEDDEKIKAVMNAIRPMHPAYCMPGCEQVNGEMTTSIQTDTVHSDNTATSNV